MALPEGGVILSPAAAIPMPAAGLFLPLALRGGLCWVARAGLFVPRTTAALTGP
jgi:hypothetical protein